MKTFFAVALCALLSVVNAAPVQAPANSKISTRGCELNVVLLNGKQTTIEFSLVAETDAETHETLYDQVATLNYTRVCATKTSATPVSMPFESICTISTDKSVVPITLRYGQEHIMYHLGPSQIDGQGMQSWDLKCGGVVIPKY
ncbi:uncharacterized protein L969DRAFT_95007 [Mixia osmundae IAM 14324]|uniref:AA1-like domain-containing protein n=1 Tax=Mixia osmundae (strain CBS 9802 / IAM 14324 / JCM 22182 / KY 12970) TaxID=764103 RepID=G7E118_MIXOS|nr:uncharacterized protein L969DRAFT_95007 [Mixia osmundae IAM 14324]KEI38836.1 hypothetical protein L969DRAFT_95007 [Mixia osmundae IAM 14324]GAA96528.1 hypothetical protein E5Q_03196 [Mixia osmundae IAM 14324]